MNKKIFARLLGHSQNDLDKITQPWIKETFGVEVKRCDTLEQYTDAIDDACLDRYFSKYWQNDMKKWKYSGVQLIDEVNNLNPRAVLDVGCGYNEFKGKIQNLIGMDPYNRHADLQIKIDDDENQKDNGANNIIASHYKGSERLNDRTRISLKKYQTSRCYVKP